MKSVDLNEKKFFNEETDVIKIINIINSLPSKNTAGFDEKIAIDVLKFIVYYIAQPLAYIMNKRFQSDVFPDDLKIARVVPIYKSRDKMSSKLSSNL